jgi:hypothetical protein
MPTVQEMAAAMKRGNDMKEANLKKIEELFMEDEVLTDWERNFLKDMKWKYERVSGFTASSKQQKIIDDLIKHVAERYD